jgi:hypothetical protein
MAVLALVFALAVGLGTRAEAVRPHVSVTDESPFTVRGMGFSSGEHVRVVVHARNHVSRMAITGVRGGFLVRLPAVKLGSCPRYGVTATGNRGSRASFKVVRECANLQPLGP